MANPYENANGTDPFRESGLAGTNSIPGIPAQATPTYGSTTEGYSPNQGQYGSASYLNPTTEKTRESVPQPLFYPSEAGANLPSPIPAGETGAGAASSETPQTKSTSKFWTIEFYQQFFDINTRQVLLRMSNTLVPVNPPDFLLDRNWHFNGSIDGGETMQNGVVPEPLEAAGVVLSRKPDLYGPFWICTTLWITLAIVSSIMSKIAYSRSGDTTKEWSFDFTVTTVAYCVIYLYCFLFGAVVWGLMQWKNLPASLIDTVCLYGYSMFIFELVAVLCLIPVSAIQWTVVMVGGAWSTIYLLINMWHMWKTTLERSWFIGLVVFVSVFHMGLTLSFKFYFLRYSI